MNAIMKRFPVLLLVMTFVASIDAAELKTGTFEGNSRSIRLLESSFLALGYGTVTTSFTTYDGSTSIFPLWQQLPGGFAFSAELRPRAGASGGALYDTDYATSSSSLSSWIAYGSYTITLPTTDTDAKGLADWSQLNQEANVAFSGTAYQDYPTVDVRPFSGTLLRPAGAFAGMALRQSAAAPDKDVSLTRQRAGVPIKNKHLHQQPRPASAPTAPDGHAVELTGTIESCPPPRQPRPLSAAPRRLDVLVSSLAPANR